jgi:predicted DNA-binding transcriptional regulator AlpA
MSVSLPTIPPPADPLLPPVVAAQYLGMKEQTLAVWRMARRKRKSPPPPLPFIRLGRQVRYRLSDLQAFLAAETVHPKEARP